MRATPLTLAAIGALAATLSLTACGNSGTSNPTPTTTTPRTPSTHATTAPATPKDHTAGNDVKIDSCEVDPTTGFPAAKITITNHSSKTSNYAVQVEFVNAGGTRLDEGLAATNNLASGQASEETAQGTTQVSGTISCKVTDVTRYASVG